MQKIILASQSPRRKQLLEWAEVPFEAIIQNTAESYPQGMPLEEIPIHIARNKANAVKDYLQTLNDRKYPDIILAADTIVVLNDKVIGKPVDRNDALDILTALCGQTHKVITGVVVLYPEGEIAFSDITTVEFYPMSQDQLEFYIDKYKPYDKAGAYAIQEWIGVTGIKSVNGDFYNVMGLPVSKVVQELQKITIDT